MSQIGLEEWAAMNDIKALTVPYMDSGDCVRMKQQIAKVLLRPQSAGRAHDRDKHGRTALHRAALKGDVEEIEAQVDQGADINAADQKGWTPLICALKQDHIEAFRALINFGADINKSDLLKQTPLHLSFGAGEMTLEGKKKDYLTYRMILIHEPNIELNSKDLDQKTPLHFAVMSLIAFFVDLLISKGADVNAKDKWDRTAMHYAVVTQSEDIMETLYKHGADINAKDNGGQTALHWAGGMNVAHLVTWLCDHGADTKLLDNYSQTPLQVAVASGAQDSKRAFLQYQNRPIDSRQAPLQTVLQSLRIGEGRLPAGMVGEEEEFASGKMKEGET
jgi:ankyrin repeat protein